MGTTYVLHIAAGAVGLLTGFTALYAAKGGRLHRTSGKIFVGVMLAMCAAGVVLAVAEGSWAIINVPAAWTTAYLVVTSFVTVRRPAGWGRGLDAALAVVALAVGIAMLALGAQAIAQGGSRNGIPAFPFLLFGVTGTLAGLGDFRVLRTGPPRGTPRLRRHLWRMSFALFIASMSFFIGQADVFPESLRIMPLLAVPPVAVLGAMGYYAVRGKR